MSDIAKEIESLRQMDVPELVERYEELFGKAPRIKGKQWLWRRCCWKVQERKYGGLSRAAKRRLEELIAEIDIPALERHRTVSGSVRGPRRPDDPPVGTVLTRKWKGAEIRIQIIEGGYECDGVVYKSASALARAVTGSRWNGRLWLGLTERKRKKS